MCIVELQSTVKTITMPNVAQKGLCSEIMSPATIQRSEVFNSGPILAKFGVPLQIFKKKVPNVRFDGNPSSGRHADMYGRTDT
jgi:hypothetical protein